MQFDKKKNQSSKLKPYSHFSQIYDKMMSHVPYRKWAAYLFQKSISLLGHKPAHILDLGCGTGVMLACLADTGSELTGIDNSSAMINLARQKYPHLANWIEASFVHEIPLPERSIAFAYSSHDCLNYLMESAELLAHFKAVKRVLQPEGVYIADFVTLENIKLHYDGKISHHSINETKLVWSNKYHLEKDTLESRLRFTHTQSKQVHQEIHWQRYYSNMQIEALSHEAGLVLTRIDGDYNQRDPKKGDSFRNYIFRAE